MSVHLHHRRLGVSKKTELKSEICRKTERSEGTEIIMDSFTKQLLIVVFGLVFTVSSIAWAISWYWTTTTRTAIENGYTTEVLPGSSSRKTDTK